ncbi:MAG TPA: flagellar motor switch protein FliN [Bryobacteraceae bacterium]|nr:flagellar motor switch protein FliN [Bryobacteraceae bacterium]
MSTGEHGGPVRLDSEESSRQILDQWAETLAQVLESMTDQRPAVRWQAASGSLAEVAPAEAGAEPEILWWEQPLQVSPEAIVWVAAPRATWEHAGTLTLKAAGLETVEASEARNTWLEILGQSLSALARAVGGLMGREVTCDAGREHDPDTETREWAVVTMAFGETSLPPLLVAFSPKLQDLILTPPAPAADPPPRTARTDPGNEPAPTSVVRSRTMDLLLDVDLPVSISFGRTQLPMKDVLKLTTGSIVELNRGVNEPVEVLVNRCLIARGEVVVVDGNYGVRIQEIASRQDRLRSLR